MLRFTAGKKKTVTTYVKKIRMGMAVNPARQEEEDEDEGMRDHADQPVDR